MTIETEKPINPILAAVLCLGIAALLTIGGLAIHGLVIADKATLGVAESDVDRKNFEQTKAYRDGVRQDFADLMASYTTAAAEQKPAIVSLMRHRAADVPPELVPPEVRALIGGAP